MLHFTICRNGGVGGGIIDLMCKVQCIKFCWFSQCVRILEIQASLTDSNIKLTNHWWYIYQALLYSPCCLVGLITCHKGGFGWPTESLLICDGKVLGLEPRSGQERLWRNNRLTNTLTDPSEINLDVNLLELFVIPRILKCRDSKLHTFRHFACDTSISGHFYTRWKMCIFGFYGPTEKYDHSEFAGRHQHFKSDAFFALLVVGDL